MQNHNGQLKGEVQRYKRKYKDASADNVKMRKEIEELMAKINGNNNRSGDDVKQEIKVKEAVKEVEDKISKIEFENPIVTQTVEVMNQSEMIQSLIDTYASKTGFNNYLINPCQMIPHIDFSPENTADLVNEEKFAKPFWFIPPIQTDFSRGRPKSTIKLNKEIVRSTLRKSICGLLRVAGFSEASKKCINNARGCCR